MSLAKSSFLFTIGTFLSRLTGLVRDSVLTGVFGAGPSIEAFFIANRIPNLFRDMLAEGALGSSFTKIYTSLSVEDEERAHRLLCDAFRFGFYFLIFISLAGYISAPFMVDVFTFMRDETERPPSFHRETINLTRMLFPFLGFAILAALAGGVLQQKGQFFAAAVSSSALNLGYIFGAIGLAQACAYFLPESVDLSFADRQIVGLTIGVVLGGLFHFGTQFILIWRQLIRVKGWTVSKQIFSVDLKKVFILMAPAAIASSAGSINLLVNTNFATSLETGAVTWLTYAFRLLQLPIGIFAVAVGSVTLPSLSRAVAEAGHRVNDKVMKELEVSCEFINWLMVPCLAFLLFNALPVVKLLFQHGKFSESSAIATADALYAYSFGVIGYGLIKVLSSFYYAVERTSFAMKVSLISVVLNLVFNTLLVTRFGHIGLAATASICLSVNALMLGFGLRYSGITLTSGIFSRNYLYLLAAFMLCAIGQYMVEKALAPMLVTLPIKGGSMVLVLTNSMLVAGVFGVFAMVRLGWSPQEALAKVRSLRRRR